MSPATEDKVDKIPSQKDYELSYNHKKQMQVECCPKEQVILDSQPRERNAVLIESLAWAIDYHDLFHTALHTYYSCPCYKELPLEIMEVKQLSLQNKKGEHNLLYSLVWC